MIYIGIDPGFEGALAVIKDENDLAGRPGGFSVAVYDTPTFVVGKAKGADRREFDESGMYRILSKAPPFNTPPSDVLVGIEEVGPRPMEGVVSVFRFGMGYGIWLGIIAALGLSSHKIPPAKWKRDVFGTRGMEKDASVAKAEQLFPLLEFRTQRGRLLDGRAEALLIADYIRRMRVQGKV